MPHTENCINIHCTLSSESTRFRIISTLINQQRAPQISDDADADDSDDADNSNADSNDAYDSVASINSLAAR